MECSVDEIKMFHNEDLDTTLTLIHYHNPLSIVLLIVTSLSRPFLSMTAANQ